MAHNRMLDGEEDTIRIYKFGDESDIYDTGLDSDQIYAENNCRKCGTLHRGAVRRPEK